MATFRNCGMEALDIDLAPPGDPKAYAGSSNALHDLRQGLVSPSTQPQTIGREYVPRAVRASGSIKRKVSLRRVGATRAKRPRQTLHRSQSRLSAAGDIPQAQPSRFQRTGATTLAQHDHVKLSRRQGNIGISQFLRSLPIYRDHTLPRPRSAPFGNAREAPQQSRFGSQPNHEDDDLNWKSASLQTCPPPSAGKQSTVPRTLPHSQSTRNTTPTPRRQLLADPSRHKAVAFSRRPTFDRPGRELDALTKAAERLRLEEQAGHTGHANIFAALRRKFGKRAMRESIEKAVRLIDRDFKYLMALGQWKLENEAAPEQGPKHAASSVPKQAGALCRKVSIVKGLVGFLGRSNPKVLKYDLFLRNLKQQATDLVEQHHQHASKRRDEHERALRQTMTKLRNLLAKLDSIREETTRELLKLQEKLEREDCNKRKYD